MKKKEMRKRIELLEEKVKALENRPPQLQFVPNYMYEYRPWHNNGHIISTGGAEFPHKRKTGSPL